MKTNKTLTLIILLLISSISYSQTNLVNGTTHLIGQTNHEDIMVVFERTAPGTTYDTCFTDVSGDYSKSIADGIYSVHYIKNGYLTTTIDNQAVYAATTLPTQLLDLGGLSGSLSGIIQKGNYKIIGDITIDQSDTLVIEAGVQFLFMEDIEFNVEGLLLVNGDNDDKIIFTKINNSSGWGGIFIKQNADDNTILSHCVVEYSKMDGIDCYRSSPTIINSTIRNNTGNAGIVINGDFDNTLCKPRIINCIITNNNGLMGGGILCMGADAEITNCLLSNNTASDHGGGICIIYNCQPVITNSTIINNAPDGIDSYMGNNVTVINSIISFNTQVGVDVRDAKIYNSNMFGNSINFDLDDIWIGKDITINNNNDSVDAYGNFQLDPQFSNDPLKTLSAISPCIDAGVNDSIIIPSDLMNNIRIYDGNSDLDTIVDMGATEFNSSAYINTNIVNLNDKSFNISLYPNPATNSFNILLNADEELEYIEIFDIAGRSIDIIYTKELKVDVSSLKSGMYLINLKTNKYSCSKKLMVK